MNRKQNKVEFFKDYAILYDFEGNQCRIDLEDYDKIKDYCWSKDKYSNPKYWRAHNIHGKGQIKLHRLILGDKQGFVIDHRDRNVDNNTKNNLRYVSFKQNRWNSSTKRNNKSGISGVYWNQNNNRWIASICIEYKNKYLGSFINKEEAIQARLQAEADWYGEYAPQAHLFEEYHIKVKKPIMEDF